MCWQGFPWLRLASLTASMAGAGAVLLFKESGALDRWVALTGVTLAGLIGWVGKGVHNWRSGTDATTSRTRPAAAEFDRSSAAHLEQGSPSPRVDFATPHRGAIAARQPEPGCPPRPMERLRLMRVGISSAVERLWMGPNPPPLAVSRGLGRAAKAPRRVAATDRVGAERSELVASVEH